MKLCPEAQTFKPTSARLVDHEECFQKIRTSDFSTLELSLFRDMT